MAKELRGCKLIVWLTMAERNEVRDAAHDDQESDNVSDWIRKAVRVALNAKKLAKETKP